MCCEKLKCGFFDEDIHWVLMVVVFLVINTARADTSENDVLMAVHDRVITKQEFLYNFFKNYDQPNKENIKTYLKLFVDFQLKLADAREQKFHHQIGFINELTEYRLLLATPYLTDTIKENQLVKEAHERLNYELCTKHVFIKFSSDLCSADTVEAYNLAVGNYNELKEAGSFEKLKSSHSQSNSGIEIKQDTECFTAVEKDYNYETAAYNMSPGDIVGPVKSINGYYVILLDEKRRIEADSLADYEILNRIKELRDQRLEIIETSFVERLKKEWNFSENIHLVKELTNYVDGKIFKGTWEPPHSDFFNEVLFYLDGKMVFLKDFSEYLQNLDGVETKVSLEDYLFCHYRKFVAKRLIQYENYKLPEKYPLFKFQFEEYRDAMLLLQITNERVWSKASTDSAGLQIFYNNHKRFYPSTNPDSTLQENYEAVKIDYQSFLKEQWETELRAKYQVHLNEKVLKSIYLFPDHNN